LGRRWEDAAKGIDGEINPLAPLPRVEPIPISPFIDRGQGMDDSIRDSERLTIERHKRRHRNIRKKLYCATPEALRSLATSYCGR
jgi:hypothetical protein